MADALNSIGKWLKERTTSPLYGTFIFSVIAINWKFFYILFWQSEDKLELPRIEYVQQMILSEQSWLEHLSYFLIIPAIITFVAIWYLPLLANLAHKKNLDFYFKRKKVFNVKRLEFESEEKNTLVKISEIKEARAKAESVIQKLTNQEDKWAAEFDAKKGDISFNWLYKIKDIIYNNSGQTRKWDEQLGHYVPSIDADILAEADANGLIKITGNDKSNERVEWTEKGKYFLSRYLDDNKIS